jgi:DNA repair ATPase RecN
LEKVARLEAVRVALGLPPSQIDEDFEILKRLRDLGDLVAQLPRLEADADVKAKKFAEAEKTCKSIIDKAKADLQKALDEMTESSRELQNCLSRRGTLLHTERNYPRLVDPK